MKNIKKMLAVAVFILGLLIFSGCIGNQTPEEREEVVEDKAESASETIEAGGSEVMEEPVSESEPEAESASETQSALESESDPTTETQSKPEVKSFEVTARQWAFEPASITVNEGDTVQLKITSVDVEHGIKIDEFGVNQRLEPGETVNIEFTADKKGTFSMICNVYCGEGHKDMNGTIIVQ